jgi:hypothetical protein
MDLAADGSLFDFCPEQPALAAIKRKTMKTGIW